VSQLLLAGFFIVDRPIRASVDRTDRDAACRSLPALLYLLVYHGARFDCFCGSRMMNFQSVLAILCLLIAPRFSLA